MDTASFGAYGEALAERYLSSRGYDILARRWRVRYGELDLVARKGGEVVFVEVKSRRNGAFGPPEASVTEAKAARLRAAAHFWLEAHAPGTERYRIDVISILRTPDGAVRLRHLRNAVGAV